MVLVFLVEEPSAEQALREILPKIMGPQGEYEIHPFGGKHDLLSKLSDRLKGYASWMPNDRRIVILIDEDREDCHALKKRLEHEVARAGLETHCALTKGHAIMDIIAEDLGGVTWNRLRRLRVGLMKRS